MLASVLLKAGGCLVNRGYMTLSACKSRLGSDYTTEDSLKVVDLTDNAIVSLRASSPSQKESDGR